jgi:hypothetical protein
MKWDGGDRHYPAEPAFFNSEDASKFIADNKYDHFDVKTITIYDSLEEYYDVTGETLRRKALAKLTDLEKRALGLI